MRTRLNTRRENEKDFSVFFLATLFLVACGKSEDEMKRMSKMEKARKDSIYRAAFKIAVMPTMDCLPLFYAKEKGYFDSLGVDVRLPMYYAQMDCDTALTGGTVEGAITDLVRGERLAKRGTPLNYEIATNTYWQLIANHRARVRTVAQLSDKIIAITRLSATDRLAAMAIDSAKPKEEVYRVQINSVKVRLDMIHNNLLDAAFFTEPQATAARIGTAQAPAKNPVLADSRKMGVTWGVFAFRTKAMEEKTEENNWRSCLKHITGHVTASTKTECAITRTSSRSIAKWMTVSSNHYHPLSTPRHSLPRPLTLSRQNKSDTRPKEETK